MKLAVKIYLLIFFSFFIWLIGWTLFSNPYAPLQNLVDPKPKAPPVTTRSYPVIQKQSARHEPTLRFEVEPVLFTNYYTNDPTGSTHRTGSGLTTDQFEVNHLGWYTYEGKVVIATATNECLRSNGPGCYLYSEVGEGFEVYNYKDTITFMFDEQGYEGIILDSCGACHVLQPDEEHQRFDIFIADSSKSFGKKVGYLITETEW